MLIKITVVYHHNRFCRSPLGRTFENESLPGLSEDMTMSKCWQLIYKLVDSNQRLMGLPKAGNDAFVFNYKITGLRLLH